MNGWKEYCRGIRMHLPCTQARGLWLWLNGSKCRNVFPRSNCLGKTNRLLGTFLLRYNYLCSCRNKIHQKIRIISAQYGTIVAEKNYQWLANRRYATRPSLQISCRTQHNRSVRPKGPITVWSARLNGAITNNNTKT